MSSAIIGSSPGAPDDRRDSAAIRVLTLNAHQGFRAGSRHQALIRIRDGLRAARADLVFLQEVGVAEGSEAAAHQYEVLADGVWKQYAYGRNAVSTGGHHGNALLSRYPIASWQNVDVSVGRSEPRGLLHCVLEIPRAPAPLHAICVHFSLFESQRRQQVARLLDLIAGAIPSGAPLVIAGDFNDWRERAHSKLLHDRALEEIHTDANGRAARTFPARLPLLRLDRIYVRNLRHWPVQLPRRPWAKLSDHVPLAGEVRM